MTPPDFVHLVNQNEWIGSLCLLQTLNDFARHGTNISATMAFDLCHIVEAPHREAIEFAAQGLGDGLSNRRLANTGRPHKAKNLALHGPAQHAHRDEFTDTVLDVSQAVVVPVQDLPGLLQVEGVLAVNAPGHVGEPLQVVPRHLIFLRLLCQIRELLQLLIDGLLDLVGHGLALKSFFELLQKGIRSVVLVDAKLLLDRFQLLAQHELALVLRHLLLDLGGNLLLKLGELKLLLDKLQRQPGLVLPILRLEDLLELRCICGGQGGREVRHHVRVGLLHPLVVILMDHLSILAEAGVHFHYLLDGLHRFIDGGFEHVVLEVLVLVLQLRDPDLQRWSRIQDLLHADNLQAVHKHLQPHWLARLRHHRHGLQDPGSSAHPIKRLHGVHATQLLEGGRGLCGGPLSLCRRRGFSLFALDIFWQLEFGRRLLVEEKAHMVLARLLPSFHELLSQLWRGYLDDLILQRKERPSEDGQRHTGWFKTSRILPQLALAKRNDSTVLRRGLVASGTAAAGGIDVGPASSSASSAALPLDLVRLGNIAGSGISCLVPSIVALVVTRPLPKEAPRVDRNCRCLQLQASRGWQQKAMALQTPDPDP
mmetsp:Transcript_12177/g.29083  ORF Transcript_12177/g.29083 Transcript_12177/m.29083 type:complete len:595 (+) Transcript_12177:814-2598(+)